MITANRIKELKSLHQKKYRRHQNKFILEGRRIVTQAILANANIIQVWLTKKSLTSPDFNYIIDLCKKNKIQYDIASSKIISQISDSKNDQGIIALTDIPEYKKYKNAPKKSIFIDGISDPGNMGTILRTAAWFGIRSIFRSSECVDPFNSKVVRSAMGAHFYFSHFEAVLGDELLTNLKKTGIKILGSDLKGEDINSFEISNLNGWCLVLGNESRGISQETQNHINSTITIPGNQGMESLNVSVASGILLHTLTSKFFVTN